MNFDTGYFVENDSDFFWNYLLEEEQEIANSLDIRLVAVVSKIVIIIKNSLLLEEADRRDLMFNLKKMRSALHLRKYLYWDPEVLHDEGIVLGIRPASQSDREPISVKESKDIFLESYKEINPILDQIVLGNSDIYEVARKNYNTKKYRQNSAFIMMWIDKNNPELDDVRDAIREIFLKFGINAIRADEIEHEDSITPRILDEISSSEFLIADLTGSRQSVYYEIGYAHALGKRPILYRKKGTKLSFDMAGYNCPEYENLGDLKKQLEKRLQSITSRNP
jgi:hypothetical protein